MTYAGRDFYSWNENDLNECKNALRAMILANEPEGNICRLIDDGAFGNLDVDEVMDEIYVPANHKVIEVRFYGDIFASPERVVIFKGTMTECEQFLNDKYVPYFYCDGTDVYIK